MHTINVLIERARGERIKSKDSNFKLNFLLPVPHSMCPSVAFTFQGILRDQQRWYYPAHRPSLSGSRLPCCRPLAGRKRKILEIENNCFIVKLFFSCFVSTGLNSQLHSHWVQIRTHLKQDMYIGGHWTGSALFEESWHDYNPRHHRWDQVILW